MFERFTNGKFRLGRGRHMLLCAFGWSVFCIGGTLSGQLMARPGFLLAGAVLLGSAVLANGVLQLTLNTLRLRELNLSPLHAAWILVLHCAVAFLSQAGDPVFFIAAVLLLCAKSALFLLPDPPAKAPASAFRPQPWPTAYPARRKLVA